MASTSPSAWRAAIRAMTYGSGVTARRWSVVTASRAPPTFNTAASSPEPVSTSERSCGSDAMAAFSAPGPTFAPQPPQGAGAASASATPGAAWRGGAAEGIGRSPENFTMKFWSIRSLIRHSHPPCTVTPPLSASADLPPSEISFR